MKLLFLPFVVASGAAMTAAATLPVLVGGIAAMCCLTGKRAGARRALDERYARGEINREAYMNDAKTSTRQSPQHVRAAKPFWARGRRVMWTPAQRYLLATLPLQVAATRSVIDGKGLRLPGVAAPDMFAPSAVRPGS
jgi:hypothetical protein